MTDEKKIELFEAMRRLENLAEKKTFDGRDYFEQAEGAFAMLMVLGLEREYIRWEREQRQKEQEATK